MILIHILYPSIILGFKRDNNGLTEKFLINGVFFRHIYFKGIHIYLYIFMIRYYGILYIVLKCPQRCLQIICASLNIALLNSINIWCYNPPGGLSCKIHIQLKTPILHLLLIFNFEDEGVKIQLGNVFFRIQHPQIRLETYVTSFY